MMQSRLGSLAEAVANVAIGYVIAVATQVAVFPLFDSDATVAEAFSIAAIFTAVSIARSDAVRRLFERMKLGRR